MQTHKRPTAWLVNGSLAFAVSCLATLAGCGGEQPSGGANNVSPEPASSALVVPAGCGPEDNPSGVKRIEPGEPPAAVLGIVESVQEFRQRCPDQAGHAGGATPGGAGTSNDLYYHGGTGGIGVETAPKIYLVFWGSQWNNNDPSGEAAILQNFFGGVGGSSWSNSDTQYCQGVASGTFDCAGTGGTFAGNATQLAGIWYDNSGAAPSKPRQSQLAAEAVKAANHFGNTTAGSNASVQYVIATARGNSASGFGRQYCAWHSSTSSGVGNVAYTNLPYITDAGGSCGANFNGLGPKAGITIVGGHEFAETVTDQFPSSGWLDSGGAENADKCAWISSGQGAAANITLSTGTFPVQSLWSNAFNGGAGGCVLSYP